MKIVIDTNILISALLKEGLTRDFILIKGLGFEFLTPAYTLREINKYKEEICSKAKLSEEDFFILLEKIMNYIKIINPLFYDAYLAEAANLIKHASDTPFLALSLALNCPIWSDDKHFKKQGRIKILTTKDILNLTK